MSFHKRLAWVILSTIGLLLVPHFIWQESMSAYFASGIPIRRRISSTAGQRNQPSPIRSYFHLAGLDL